MPIKQMIYLPREIYSSFMYCSGEVKIITARLLHFFRDRQPLPVQTASVTLPLIFATKIWHESLQQSLEE